MDVDFFGDFEKYNIVCIFFVDFMVFRILVSVGYVEK